MRLASLLLALLLPACAAPSRPADPTIPAQPVRADLFSVQEVRLHRFSAKGCRIPDPAFRAALTTIESHLGRPIRVIDHGETETGWGENGPIAPIQDRGHPISGADVTAAGGRYMLSQPDDGILGVIDMGPIGGGRPLPLVEPGAIIVVEFPGTQDGSGVTGVTTRVAVDQGAAKPQAQSGMVILCHSALVHRSGVFISRAKLSQWTLTHELGHVLHVPASNAHLWFVPGLGPHCTNPTCVMYTGFDWRVLWTGLVRGWPLDFCDHCTAELVQACVNAQGTTH
jgi:hypothetical protein